MAVLGPVTFRRAPFDRRRSARLIHMSVIA
jgi:hypothetical protein